MNDTAPETAPVGSGTHAEVKQQALLGARWGLLASLIIQISTVASTVVPAHFLGPSEFALVGAANVVASLFFVLADAGFGEAIIASGEDDDVRISSNFWAAVGASSLVAAVVAGTSPVTARMIGTPDAAPFIAALATVLPLSMMVSVLQSVQFRRLNHRTVYLAQIGQAIATAVVPVGLVLVGVGAWALVLGRIIGAVVSVAVLVAIGRVVPRLVFDGARVRQDLGFNSAMLGTNLTSYVAKNLDYWVLGNFVGDQAFGAYYVAFVVPTIIRQRGTWLGKQMLFPVLARFRDDAARFRGAYLEVLRLVAAVVVPALVGVAAVGDLVVRVAFGDKWDLAVAPLRILAVAAAVDVVAHSSNAVFLARSEPGQLVVMQLVRMGGLAVGLIGVPLLRDVRAAAAAVALSVLVGTAYSQWALARRGVVSTLDQWRAMAPIFVPAGLMWAAVALVRRAVPAVWPPAAQLAVLVAAGGVTFVGLGSMLAPAVFRALRGRLLELAGRQPRRSNA